MANGKPKVTAPGDFPPLIGEDPGKKKKKKKGEKGMSAARTEAAQKAWEARGKIAAAKLGAKAKSGQ